MHIVFKNDHKYWGGLANNGGSRTILLSAQTLEKLGHKVDIVACADRFTWFEHRKVLKKTLDCDIVIAVSISDIDNTDAYWARPFETWQMEKKKMINKLRKYKGKIFCNSSWQVEYLKKKGIKSYLQFAGIDFDRWGDDGLERNKIGCIYSKRELKGFKDCIIIPKSEKYMLGKDFKGNNLRPYYNRCKIWFAPNRREGFHNVPAEANLCGALVVCSDRKKNGMMDYANNETAMIYNNLEEAKEMLDNPDYSKIKKMQKLLRDKIGTREENMKEFIETLKSGGKGV